MPPGHPITLHFGGAPDPLTQPELFDGVLRRRFLAYLVDLCVLGLLWLPFVLVLIIAGLLTFGLLAPLIPVSWVLLNVGYDLVLIGGRGATLGLRMFDLEVRSVDGAPPSYAQVLAMTALFYATVGLATPLILAVSLFNLRRRTLHDILSGVILMRSAPELFSVGRSAP